MADGSAGWKDMFEEYAGGDAIKLAKMKEISSWFPSVNEMVDGAGGRVYTHGKPKEMMWMIPPEGTPAIEILIQAMDEEFEDL